jgi:uncharacterized sulfatase
MPNPLLSRRQFAAATAGLIAPRRAPAAERPNIVWLTCEDTSPDLGCYGDSYARTPNLDKLAAQGARYNNAFSVYGVCAPSRSSIITGMYPSSIGTHHMRSKGVPPPYVKCFTEYLRAAGYYCTNNVKTDYNFDPPLTAWDDSSNKAHYRNRPKGAPFFAVFNTTTSHESQIRAPREQFLKQTARLSPSDRHDPAKAVLPPYYPDTPVTRRDWANYYDLVTAVDYQVADYLKQLEEDGLGGNTIVFFYGDHGRGLPRAKRWPYDSGTRAPLIVRWPGQIQPGTVVDDLVSFIDLAPTLLSIAGIEIPKHLQGQAFLGERKAAPRTYIYTARDRMDETYDLMRSVRDRRYRYIRNYMPERTYAQHIAYMDEMPTMQEWRRLHAEGKLTGPQKNFFAQPKPVEELYEITKDPHEVNNLAAAPEHQAALKRLRATHEQWTRETSDLGHLPEPELQERMRPGGKWSVTSAPRISREDEIVTITCATEGASIAYAPAGSRWQLYTKPVRVARGTPVRAKACRLGWRDSEEVSG